MDGPRAKESGAQGSDEAAPSAEAEALDARVLEVDYNAAGERYKDWKQLVLEAKDYSFSDWPLEGPLSIQLISSATSRSSVGIPNVGCLNG